MEDPVGMDSENLSTRLPVIPFSSDDIRSKHPYSSPSQIKNKLRAKMCTSGQRYVENETSQILRGLKQPKEQTTGPKGSSMQDWQSKLRCLVTKLQGIAQQGLRIGKGNF